MKLLKNKRYLYLGALVTSIFVLALVFLASSYQTTRSEVSLLQVLSMNLGEENDELKRQLAENLMSLTELESEDQFKVNSELKKKIASIERTYKKAVDTYEDLVKLKESSKNTAALDTDFTKAIVMLANQDYEEADKSLSALSTKIAAEQEKVVASFVIPPSVPVSNEAPGAGYSRQTVNTEIGQYLVSVVAGELGSTRVIVDTASASTCANDCPVLPLGEYVARNGAFAGVNGSYFCPADYPSCAGKTNTFDTLLMNKDKTYFNSDNNVYSNVPAVIFGGSYIRFIGQSSGWGRDTGIDSMIANQPMLVSGGNVAFSGDGDPKKGSKAGRSFVANKGNTVYIGVVHSSTVGEAAIVLKTMGMENALNLDSGGSTALWSGGYKVGPGRNLPNVILFVRK